MTPVSVRAVDEKGTLGNRVSAWGPNAVNASFSKARNMFVEQEHPTAGKVTLVGVPVKLSATPGGVNTPPPLLGENTEEIIKALGHADRIPALKESGAI